MGPVVKSVELVDMPTQQHFGLLVQVDERDKRRKDSACNKNIPFIPDILKLTIQSGNTTPRSFIVT